MIANSKALVRVVSAFGLFTAACLSIARGSITCDVSVPTSCRNAGLSAGSHFPNDFGHPTASAAEAALTSTFGSDRPSDSCSSELGLFACLLYFPDCRVNNAIAANVVRRPCREYCERVQDDCVNIPAVQNVSCDSFPFWNSASPTACYDPFHLIVMNEVDIRAEDSWFVELWDYGMGNTSLTLYSFIVANNGFIVELFGYTRTDGYFVIGPNNLAFDVDLPISAFPPDKGVVSIYRGPNFK